ncbi:MAG: flagellar biosynthesis anti-sigma factor FlgM [Rubripirellula sp.]
MQIYGPFRVSTTPQTSGGGRTPAAAAPTGKPTAAPVDQLDLSSTSAATSAGGVNRLGATSAIAGGGEIRTDRVADIRRQIADGSYETPEKMDAALDRLLDQFA